MKLVCIALFAFTFLILNHPSEATFAQIASIMNTNKWTCNSLVQNMYTGEICDLLSILQANGICLQVLVDYLIQQCGWSCSLVFEVLYNGGCGCFQEIQTLLNANGVSLWNPFFTDLLNNGCNFNIAFELLMCK